MRHFFHLLLKGEDSSEKKLLPIFLHFNDLKWFSENSVAIFDEICEIFLENIETIEKRSRGTDGLAESPPTRLHSIKEVIAWIFAIDPNDPYAPLPLDCC
jgi:hypothetical protein